jgi:hypothetical protein
MRASCGDPALYGERVLPISYSRGAAATSYADMAVRIAVADPAARDGYRLGPIITTYQQCSDCEISWIIGDGSLWIYNPLSNHKSLGELLRISTRTGAVLERWTMPTILRALLATNTDGLWLSPSVSGGVLSNVPRSKRLAYESLYRITANNPKPQRVLTDGGARWLVASGDVATAAIDKADGHSTIWEFTGSHTRTHGPTVSDSPMGTDEWGVDNPIVTGNNKLGYLSVLDTNDTESVIQVKPDSQREHVIAKIRSHYATDSYAPPGVVTLDGSLFYIDPATNTGRELRRVTPS